MIIEEPSLEDGLAIHKIPPIVPTFTNKNIAESYENAESFEKK